VGYRYFDTKKIEPQFPFGYGLSYAKFRYAGLHTARKADKIIVTSTVTNTSKRRGTEVAELYVSPPAGSVPRPVHELKGFDRVTLDPSQAATVRVTLDPHAFAYWEEKKHDWNVVPGTYAIALGASSRDIRLTSKVNITQGEADAMNKIIDGTPASEQADSSSVSGAPR
jgi:beta-glucosidase